MQQLAESDLKSFTQWKVFIFRRFGVFPVIKATPTAGIPMKPVFRFIGNPCGREHIWWYFAGRAGKIPPYLANATENPKDPVFQS